MQEACGRLRQAREEAGYQDAVSAAKRFGWKKSTYTHHENGIRGIRPNVAAEYARAYKVSFEWLLLGTGPKEIGIALLSPQARRFIDILETLPPENIDHLFHFMRTLPGSGVTEGRPQPSQPFPVAKSLVR